MASCGGHAIWNDYWVGCGTEMTIVGDEGYDCLGQHNQTGQTDGHWRVHYYADCVPEGALCVETEPVVSYQEKCNGIWVQRSQSDFLNGNCQC